LDRLDINALRVSNKELGACAFTQRAIVVADGLRRENASMSTEENKQLVRRFFDERWNHGNFDVYDEMLAPDLDIKSEKEWARSMYATFGNLRFTILDMIAEDDRVALHWRVDATHQGDYLGIAVTGKAVTFQGIALLRIADGKIVEDIAYWDDLSILQQLGAAPASG
jgi:predicted ester cyclase